MEHKEHIINTYKIDINNKETLGLPIDDIKELLSDNDYSYIDLKISFTFYTNKPKEDITSLSQPIESIFNKHFGETLENDYMNRCSYENRKILSGKSSIELTITFTNKYWSDIVEFRESLINNNYLDVISKIIASSRIQGFDIFDYVKDLYGKPTESLYMTYSYLNNRLSLDYSVERLKIEKPYKIDTLNLNNSNFGFTYDDLIERDDELWFFNYDRSRISPKLYINKSKGILELSNKFGYVMTRTEFDVNKIQLEKINDDEYLLNEYQIKRRVIED